MRGVNQDHILRVGQDHIWREGGRSGLIRSIISLHLLPDWIWLSRGFNITPSSFQDHRAFFLSFESGLGAPFLSLLVGIGWISLSLIQFFPSSSCRLLNLYLYRHPVHVGRRSGDSPNRMDGQDSQDLWPCQVGMNGELRASLVLLLFLLLAAGLAGGINQIAGY